MTADPLFIQSIEKAMSVLWAFSNGEQYLGLAEIEAISGLDKSATQRFTHTLAKVGLLNKCPRTKRFSLRPVEIQDSTLGLIVIQALDGTIRTDRRPMGEDGAALFGQAD